MNATDFCTLDGRNPLVTQKWLDETLAPLAKKLFEDSRDCGGSWMDGMDEGEWIAYLRRDLAQLVENQRPAPAPKPERTKWTITAGLITGHRIALTAESAQPVSDYLEIDIIVVNNTGMHDRYQQTPFYYHSNKRHTLCFRVTDEEQIKQFSPAEIIADIVAEIFHVPTDEVTVSKQVEIDDSWIPF